MGAMFSYARLFLTLWYVSPRACFLPVAVESHPTTFLGSRGSADLHSSERPRLMTMMFWGK